MVAVVVLVLLALVLVALVVVGVLLVRRGRVKPAERPAGTDPFGSADVDAVREKLRAPRPSVPERSPRSAASPGPCACG